MASSLAIHHQTMEVQFLLSISTEKMLSPHDDHQTPYRMTANHAVKTVNSVGKFVLFVFPIKVCSLNIIILSYYLFLSRMEFERKPC